MSLQYDTVPLDVIYNSSEIATVAGARIPERLPLQPAIRNQKPYPVNALGPVLGEAAKAIANKIQVPVSMAAQSVLATAALAAQAHRDVRLPFGQTRPLSGFFITIAGSGDRKTSADAEALWPIQKAERNRRESFQIEMVDWEIRKAAHSAQKKKIEMDKNLSLVDRENELRALGNEPQPPLSPTLLAPDPTIEGLFKYWVNAPASLGLFSSEGGQFTGGHSMNDENRRKTGAALSDLWGGEPVRRMRAGDGLTLLLGRRLSCHLMIQPEAASDFLSDPVLKDQGLPARFLIAAPDSLAGTRFYKEPSPKDDAAIRQYSRLILDLLELPPPLTEGKRNELCPPVLDLSPLANSLWRNFSDRIERECGRAGRFESVRAFASKANEHVARLSGVLTVCTDHRLIEIEETALQSAIDLVDWYLDELLRLTDAGQVTPSVMKAQRLLDWLLTQRRDTITFLEIMRYGPSSLRSKAAVENAATILASHGWVSISNSRPRALTLIPDQGE